jgi:hypothetical protein
MNQKHDHEYNITNLVIKIITQMHYYKNAIFWNTIISEYPRGINSTYLLTTKGTTSV